jgi:hypothetical protein
MLTNQPSPIDIQKNSQALSEAKGLVLVVGRRSSLRRVREGRGRRPFEASVGVSSDHQCHPMCELQQHGQRPRSSCGSGPCVVDY